MNEKLRSVLLYGKDFCEDTAENLRETLAAAVDSAKLQYRITSQRKQLNAMYAVLGRLSLSEDDSTGEKEKLLPRIEKKEEILSGLEDQLRIVCGKVICPNCGRFMSEKYLFCPWCGRPTGAGSDDTEADVTGEELIDIREIDGSL